jgi:hypothetical protein
VANVRALPQSASDKWRYSCVVAAESQTAAMARAFVCHHLIDHRLLHLVDTVRFVAGELAIDAVVEARIPSTFTLSKAGRVILLDLTDGSTPTPTGRHLMSEHSVGSGTRQLRTLDVLGVTWGTFTGPAGNRTVWASFDAHLRRRPITGRAAPAEAA